MIKLNIQGKLEEIYKEIGDKKIADMIFTISILTSLKNGELLKDVKLLTSEETYEKIVELVNYETKSKQTESVKHSKKEKKELPAEKNTGFVL